jgi:hypothetical protein
MVNVALATMDAAFGFLEMSLQDVLAHELPCNGPVKSARTKRAIDYFVGYFNGSIECTLAISVSRF